MGSALRSYLAASLAIIAGGLPVRAEDRVAALTQATHPMDALTAAEITASVDILRKAGDFDDAARIVFLALDENPKADVRAWKPGAPFARRALATVVRAGRLFEARLDLTAGRLTDWREVLNHQAALTIEEIISAGDIPRTDATWRAAMAKRGITDFKTIACFPLTVGPAMDPALAGRRLLNVPCVDTAGAANNLWGKPIEGLFATVDVGAGTVVSVTDLGVVPEAPSMPSHAYADSGRYRAVPKPVSITAPEGSNIKVDGGQVRWDNWSFHVRLEPRLGTVLSLIRYDDRGERRDIAYQLSASEMFVPYMDPAASWSFRAYMDIGEYGFGTLATTLRPGEDCPASATFLDMTIAGNKGEPIGLPGVVCVFERPTADPVWRHVELFNDTREIRPNTELVVRMAPVVGNYDYIVDYVFDRAGNIDVRLGAFGIDATKGVASDTLKSPGAAADTAYGTLIDTRLLAVNHDHYMAFRIDMDVDGTENRLVEDRFVPHGIDGPRKSLWQLETKTVATEGPIDIPMDAAQFRVESTTRTNKMGYPTSYQLLPGHTATSLLAYDEPIQVRASFTEYSLWATAYSQTEKYAAGVYPNENPDVDGLPRWVAAKRPIDRQDLVLWYTIGFRHVPRAEDWPAMPGLWHGFRLRPFNFFDRSPAIDVPPAGPAQ
jgi:primary-amine oxidase